MTYKANDNDWDVMRDYIEKAIRDPDTLPDKLIILPVSSREISSIMTNKRMELINTIKENRNSLTVTQLSRILGRKESAIQRDLSLLERYSIIQIKKKGRATIPQVFAESIVFPLESKIPRDMRELIEKRNKLLDRFELSVIPRKAAMTSYTSYPNQSVTISDDLWVESSRELTEGDVISLSCSIPVR